jgi:hypothetical protein
VEPRDLLPAARDCGAAHRNEIEGLSHAMPRSDAALFRSLNMIAKPSQSFGVVEHAASLSPERAGASAFLVDDGNALIFNRQLPISFADDEQNDSHSWKRLQHIF